MFLSLVLRQESLRDEVVIRLLATSGVLDATIEEVQIGKTVRAMYSVIEENPVELLFVIIYG